MPPSFYLGPACSYTPPHPLPRYRQVYELLADRASGPGEQAVSLAQREESYQAAVLQVGTGVQSKGITRGLVVGLDSVTGNLFLSRSAANPSFESVGALTTAASLPTNPPCVQAKSYGDAELLDRLEGKARIVALQQRLADALAAAGGAGWVGREVGRAVGASGRQ